MIHQISVTDLKSKLDNKEDLVLVDCREAEEHEFCKIDGSVLIPLSRFQESYEEHLKPEQNVVIHCHHGGRSQRACEFLESKGFQNLSNVTGGIEAWSLQVDSSVKRY